MAEHRVHMMGNDFSREFVECGCGARFECQPLMGTMRCSSALRLWAAHISLEEAEPSSSVSSFDNKVRQSINRLIDAGQLKFNR